MKVIIKEPGKPGQVVNIQNTLRNLQAVVGGYIETVRIAADILAIVDDEGRLKGKPENTFGLNGTIVFCGVDGEEFTDVPTAAVRVLCGKSTKDAN